MFERNKNCVFQSCPQTGQIKVNPGTTSGDNLNIKFHYNDIIENNVECKRNECSEEPTCDKRLKFTLFLVFSLCLSISRVRPRNKISFYAVKVLLCGHLTIIILDLCLLSFSSPLYFSYRFISRRNRFEGKKKMSQRAKCYPLLSPYISECRQKDAAHRYNGARFQRRLMRAHVNFTPWD